MTPKAKRTTFIVLTAFFGLGIGVGAFAFLSLIGAWFGVGDREIHQVHDLAYGAQVGVLFAVPLLIQAFNPERKPAVMMVAMASGVGSAVGYGLGGAWFFIPVVVLVVGVLWWLHPARDEIRLKGVPFDPIMWGLALIAAVPLVIYALDQAAIQRTCLEGDPHCAEFHFAGMAALAMALPLAGLMASRKIRGWRIASWLTGAAAGVFGLSNVLFPDHTSSVGELWGWAALGGAVVFVVVAELRARRRPTG